jgi:hypothetical protein
MSPPASSGVRARILPPQRSHTSMPKRPLGASLLYQYVSPVMPMRAMLTVGTGIVGMLCIGWEDREPLHRALVAERLHEQGVVERISSPRLQTDIQREMKPLKQMASRCNPRLQLVGLRAHKAHHAAPQGQVEPQRAHRQPEWPPDGGTAARVIRSQAHRTIRGRAQPSIV